MNTTTPIATAITRSKEPGLMERLDTFLCAWTMFAPDAPIGVLSFNEMKSAVQPSKTVRVTLAELALTIKGKISIRNNADAAASALLLAVVSGVKADQEFGVNSPLYRAMGYIPASERKPQSTPPTVPGVKATKPDLMARIAKIVSAWTELAPDAVFSGHSIAGFQTAVAPCRTARAELIAVRTHRSANVGLKSAADEASLEILNRAVANVKGDANFGPDCALYRALGYVTKSERRTPRRPTVSPEAPQA